MSLTGWVGRVEWPSTCTATVMSMSKCHPEITVLCAIELGIGLAAECLTLDGLQRWKMLCIICILDILTFSPFLVPARDALFQYIIVYSRDVF